MWNTLTLQEQQLIREPFPIVYGINYTHRKTLEPRVQKLRPEDRATTDEEFIEGKVDARVLTVFCPRGRIEEIKNYLKGRGLEATSVLSLEVFAFLVDLWKWQSGTSEYLYATNHEDIIRGERKWMDFNERFPTIHSYINALRRWETKSPS